MKYSSPKFVCKDSKTGSHLFTLSDGRDAGVNEVFNAGVCEIYACVLSYRSPVFSVVNVRVIYGKPTPTVNTKTRTEASY